MYEHFQEKYPEQFGAISALARVNAALRAVLADYEEISTWMAALETSKTRDPIEIDRARTLARELETEILNQLGENVDVVE